MTANPALRRRSTQIGAVIALVGVIVFAVVVFVAVSTLRSSNEGRAPETDQRAIISFPSTPNALLAVVDDLDRLTSLVVLTLNPQGSGGTIVVVPVNADASNGFGPERAPISRQAYRPGDDDAAAGLVSRVEPLLTLTIERGAILGPDELAPLLAPFAPLEVDLPEDVVDTDTAGTGVMADEGEQVLDLESIVNVLTSISAEGTSYSHHDVDVAMWRALTRSPVDASGVDLPLDEFDRPVAPTSINELIGRLFAGDVAARDLAIDRNGMRSVDNAADADFVIVDRRDALLVFGSVSPGLVSSPNEAPSFQLIVPFAPSDVEALGEEADGSPISKTSMTRRFIGELIFKQANIVAVDLSDDPSAVPERTILRVADEASVEAVRAISERFFGDADVEVADEVTDGVDVSVVLGQNFLEQRDILLEIERSEFDDGLADFDVSGDDTEADTDTVDDDG